MGKRTWKMKGKYTHTLLTYTCIHTPNLLPRGASIVPVEALHLLWWLGASQGKTLRGPRRGRPSSNISLLYTSTSLQGGNPHPCPYPSLHPPGQSSGLRQHPYPQQLGPAPSSHHLWHLNVLPQGLLPVWAVILSPRPTVTPYPTQKNKCSIEATCNFLPQTPF